ncbi:hypothetical protein [Streptosporangium lutulentum]|uniref:hypothetical protein n=1 Tax=Streptosporangium lutulentum TaxID=1461250 RepID=UPI00363EE1AD
MATDAGAVVSEGDRFDPVGGAQVVEVFGTGPFQPALIGGEKRLTYTWCRFSVTFEQRPYLFDHIREGDAMRKAMTFNPCCPKLWITLFIDQLGDMRRALPDSQAFGPNLPR